MPSAENPDGELRSPPPSLREALAYWWVLGCTSFGGPAGQIAMMHREVVERKGWISESHFLRATQFAMLLPGPEAQQLATYIGWRLHGIPGGLAAGILFILPGAVLMFGLSVLYVLGQELAWMSAILRGLNAAVIALIASAIVRLARRSLRTASLAALAAMATILIFGFHISFAMVVLLGACAGILGNRIWPQQFPASAGHGNRIATTPTECEAQEHTSNALRGRRVGWVLAIMLTLWMAPTLIAGMCWGWSSTLARQGLFFSKAALVTFGGAYAVLPYVSQQAVDTYGWLSGRQMMAGLALAESTPGPLILVLQFVGFLGAFQHPDGMPPWLAASLGAMLTTWVTFVPSFLFIFAAGPWVEHLDRQRPWSAALGGITATVVGGMASLGIGFALDATRLVSSRPDAWVIALSIACFAALRHPNIRAAWLVGASGAASWLAWMVGLAG